MDERAHGDVIEDEIVASPPRRSRWLSSDRLGLAVVIGLLLVAVLWRIATWQLDYFAFLPGDAISTEGRVQVADEALSFEDDGVLYFTTVRSRRVTVLDYLQAQFDDSIELRDADEILQGRTTSERRAENQQAMLTSQETATVVAFAHLGVDLVEEDGAVIVRVAPDTAADQVLEVGDVVLAAGERRVGVSQDLVEVVGALRPGDELDLVVRPHEGGDEEVRSVVLGANDDGGPLLGVQLTTNVARILDPPVDVEIDAGNVGGPSAGLAWTLAVLDQLTPGDLTGGREVAVTGTIDINGAVGPIGGITQKVIAVGRRGIDVFIVPAVHVPEAEAAAGDGLEIIGVETLDDALAALASLGGNALALEPPAELLSGT